MMRNRLHDQEFGAPEPESNGPGLGTVLGFGAVLTALGGLAAAALSGGDKATPPAARPMGAGPRRLVRRKRNCNCGR